MREFAFILFVCVIAVAAFADDHKPVVYRIRTEEAVTPPAGVTLTEDERKAVARLNTMMERWPRKLWLFSNNGQLMLAKMGDDGKPLGAIK
jgi:hypothetical protein